LEIKIRARNCKLGGTCPCWSPFIRSTVVCRGECVLMPWLLQIVWSLHLCCGALLLWIPSSSCYVVVKVVIVECVMVDGWLTMWKKNGDNRQRREARGMRGRWVSFW